MALHIIKKSDAVKFSYNMLNPKSDATLHAKIDLFYVQFFKNRYQMVRKTLTG